MPLASLFRPALFLTCTLVAACAPDWKDSKDSDLGGKGGDDDNDDDGTGGGASGDKDAGGGKNTGKDAGPCQAGAVRCDELGTSTQLCTSESGWQTKSKCDSVCAMGKCTGMCKPDEKQCGLEQTPETCSEAGEWVADPMPCEFACTDKGKCAGMCKPGEMRCNPKSTKVPQECDETGQWKSADACEKVCVEGACGGMCKPGAMRCGMGNMKEKCSDEGAWLPDEACEFVCTGEGMCTGECKPGAGECDGQTPRSCDEKGNWKSNPECKNQTCIASVGKCMGECAPDEKKCGANYTTQTCDPNGKFVTGQTCPAVCKEGECTGVCRPGTKMCEGATKKTCKEDGSAWAPEPCPTAGLPANQTATCDPLTVTCGSKCAAPNVLCGTDCYKGADLAPFPNYVANGCDKCVDGYEWRGAFYNNSALDHTCVSIVDVDLDPIGTTATRMNTTTAGIFPFCDSATSSVPRNAYFGDLTCTSTGVANQVSSENSYSSKVLWVTQHRP